MKIELLKEVGSTNDYIKAYISEGEDTIVCADRQTGGKGTKGRAFASDTGGVYLSALTFYDGVRADETFRVMTHAAVAVCRTVREFGLSPEIKWPNDVYVRGRKVCGILIENGISEGFLRWSVVGIGVNVNNDLSALGGIAVSISEAAEREVGVAEARRRLIENLQKPDTLADYLSYVTFLGKKITVTEGERVYAATALRITDDGRLEIEENGERRTLTAAEISVKL